MNLIDKLKNTFLYSDKYKTDSEAVIIACYFNPQQNPYRLKAFKIWYETIKHLNHRIVECVINDSLPELNSFRVGDENYSRVYTKNLLWHKEALLNGIIAELPSKYKYIFWCDTDILFTNDNWLVDAVKVLQTNNLVQPFEYCVHLDQDQLEPSFDITHEYDYVSDIKTRHPSMWKSFGANHAVYNSSNKNYDMHGHVGFIWGARREVLDMVPLYDKALIGGADHIMAHAGAGQIGHSCITKSFTDDIDAVNYWSERFFIVVKGKIGYVKGNVYHIWHGDLASRQYLKRIQEFTPISKKIADKDENGLYITNDDETYIKDYFDKREVKSNYVPVDLSITELYPDVQKKHNIKPQLKDSVFYQKRAELVQKYPDKDDSFIDSIIWGYITDSTIGGTLMGGNMMGAMIGDMLNDTNDTNTNNTIEFGGGESGGAGSGGSYEVDNENFS